MRQSMLWLPAIRTGYASTAYCRRRHNGGGEEKEVEKVETVMMDVVTSTNAPYNFPMMEEISCPS